MIIGLKIERDVLYIFDTLATLQQKNRSELLREILTENEKPLKRNKKLVYVSIRVPEDINIERDNISEFIREKIYNYIKSYISLIS